MTLTRLLVIPKSQPALLIDDGFYSDMKTLYFLCKHATFVFASKIVLGVRMSDFHFEAVGSPCQGIRKWPNVNRRQIVNEGGQSFIWGAFLWVKLSRTVSSFVKYEVAIFTLQSSISSNA